MTLDKHVNASLQKQPKTNKQKRHKQNFKKSNKTVYEAPDHSLAVFIWLQFLL